MHHTRSAVRLLGHFCLHNYPDIFVVNLNFGCNLFPAGATIPVEGPHFGAEKSSKMKLL
jgi:hypothetical protein